KRREEPPCVLLDHGQVAHLERAAPPDARGTRRRRAREERRLDARRELPYTLDVPRARPALDLARLRLVGEKRGVEQVDDAAKREAGPRVGGDDERMVRRRGC